MGRFTDALDHLNKSIDLYTRPNACDYIINCNRKLACAYNNKGLVLKEIGEFNAALECINKSLGLRKDDATLPEQVRNRLAVERSYNHENLALVYQDMSNYELALHHLQETLNIRNEKLPSNHYMIAQAYNNLGRVYLVQGKSSEALKCIEQALTRQVQSLPDNHPHLSVMYNSLGEVYYNQGQFAMALVNFEKALHIHQTARTQSRLHEAIVFGNMGSVMKAQGNFDGALVTFLQALTIQKREKPRHPDVARSLNNIGFAYLGKGDSPTAIMYFKQALNFCQSYLAENNEITAISYLSLASQFTEDQYDLAMEYFQRVITIYNHIGLPHHQSITVCHTCRGHLYRKRNEHQSALTCYEQALFHCREASIPQQHPLWVGVYTSFAHEYELCRKK
jgi:tetratricopeptide (TPR) repeat protein